MSYQGLGLDFFNQPCGGYPLNTADYLYGGIALSTIQNVVEDTVTVLLHGGGDYVALCDNKYFAYVPGHPEIAAIFGSREEEARLLAGAVLSTMLTQERVRPGTHRTTLQFATDIVTEITKTLYNGGDPSACESTFAESFLRWQGLSALSVPTSLAKTGWCEKALSLPWSSDGRHVTSCEAQSICKVTTAADGKPVYYPVPAPSPTDPGVAVKAAGNKPEPPPSKAEIEAAVQKKMGQTGESLAEAELSQEYLELTSYLKALTESRTWLRMALGLSKKATDRDVMNTLRSRGISASEVLDWFDGCNFETNCFRREMNVAIGESTVRLNDRRAKFAVLGLAAVATAFFFYKELR